MSKPMLLLLFCLAAGMFQNWQQIGDRLGSAKRPVNTADASVVLYATKWCGYCAKTRRFFAETGITYRELDVEDSPQGRDEFAKLGGSGVPIIVINEATVIRGYDPEAIGQALGLAP